MLIQETSDFFFNWDTSVYGCDCNSISVSMVFPITTCALFMNSPFSSNRRIPEQTSVIRWLPGASYWTMYPTLLRNLTSHLLDPWQPVSSETKNPTFTFDRTRSSSKQMKMPHLSHHRYLLEFRQECKLLGHHIVYRRMSVQRWVVLVVFVP